MSSIDKRREKVNLRGGIHGATLPGGQGVPVPPTREQNLARWRPVPHALTLPPIGSSWSRHGEVVVVEAHLPSGGRVRCRKYESGVAVVMRGRTLQRRWRWAGGGR